MSVAQKFLTELKEGKIEEAIETIQAGLKESTDSKILEHRNEVLESYGFSAIVEAEDDKDKDDTKDDDKDKEEDKEPSDDDDKDGDE